MNILFISPQPYPYGMAASKRIRLFAEYLAKNNRVKAIICGRNNASNDLNGIKNGVEWQLTPFSRLDYFMNFTKIHRILKNNLKKGEDNVIMLYDGIGLTNIMFAIIGRKLGYKVFTDIVEDYSVSEEKESVIRRLLLKINIIIDRFINSIVDGVIVISEQLSNKYKDSNLIYIPISAENMNAVCNKTVNESYTYIYSGSFGVKDGINYLIEAFESFSQQKDVKLLLSGTITSEIRKVIENKPQIDYLGLIPDEDYYCFLNSADVLMMTRIDSKYANSGFPFKLGEYLATSKPVIATEVSNLSSFLKHNYDIIFAKPSNISSLIEALKYTYYNREIVEEIGKQGKKTAFINFNVEINGLMLEEFLLKNVK